MTASIEKESFVKNRQIPAGEKSYAPSVVITQVLAI